MLSGQFTVLCLLLALASGFSGIGFCAWNSARQQLEEVDSQYTTLALPIEQKVKTGSYTVHEDGSLLWLDGTVTPSAERVSNAALAAPQLLSLDRRCLLGAHVEGMRGYTSGSLDPLQYVAGFDKYRYNRAVLALRCVEVSKSPVFSEERENLPFYDYDVSFETVAILQRNPVYDLPPENDMIYLKSCCLRNENGAIPFEPGKWICIIPAICRDLQ